MTAGFFKMIDDDSLAAERARLDHLKDDGTICRACEQYFKLYKRHLTAFMIRALMRLARRQGNWVHCRDIGSAGWEIMKSWRLIEDRPAELGVKSNGWWRITARGLQFLRGEIAVPKEMYFLRGVSEGPVGGQAIFVWQVRGWYAGDRRYEEWIKLELEGALMRESRNR